VGHGPISLSLARFLSEILFWLNVRGVIYFASKSSSG